MYIFYYCCSVAKSCLTSLQPHARQHSRRFLSPTISQSLPKFMSTNMNMLVMPSNHRILCRPLLLLPTISSSITLSSCLQSFPASGSLPMSQLFASSGQSIGALASASVLPVNMKDSFPLGLTGINTCFIYLNILYKYTHTRAHTYTHNIHIHTCIHTTHTYTHIYTHTRIHINVYTHVYTQYIYKHIYIYITIHTHIYTQYIYIHTEIYTRTQIYTHTEIHTYTHIYAHTHVYIYIYVAFTVNCYFVNIFLIGQEPLIGE